MVARGGRFGKLAGFTALWIQAVNQEPVQMDGEQRVWYKAPRTETESLQ